MLSHSSATMVHLGQVANDHEINRPIVESLEGLALGPPGQDEYTASIYGSRFAAQDLPKHEMPEDEMPREVAYRMIKDDLTLDGTPTLK